MNRRQDGARFAALITGLGELYGREPSEALLELYWRALADRSIEELERAASLHVRTEAHFPKPAELLRNEDKASADLRALEAWNVTQRAVADVGSYQTPTFDDPLTQRAVRLLGGWRSFCRPSESEHWQQKRFVEVYRDLLAEERRAALPEATDGKRKRLPQPR